MKQRIPTILQALVVLALILGLVPLRTFAQGASARSPTLWKPPLLQAISPSWWN